MNFQNISETYTNEVGGTHYQGEIDVSYDKLVETFGEPTDGDDYKTQKEWVIKFYDGTIATIYDWKWGYEYNGEDGTHYTNVPTWNIGGFSKQALFNVMDALK